MVEMGTILLEVGIIARLGSSSNGNSYLYEYTSHGWEGVAMFEDVQLDKYNLKGGAFDYV